MIELFKHLMKRRPQSPPRRGAGATAEAPRGDGCEAPVEQRRLDDLPPEPEWLTLSRSLWP